MPTTICFDTNNLAFRNLFGPDVILRDPKDYKKVINIDYDIFKFRMFDSIYKSIYKAKNVREVILAIDDRRSWRKLYWTRYKAHRKGARDKLDMSAVGGWETFFDNYDSFMQEIKENIPFKVIQCKDTEGDDIIGHLTLSKPNDYYIISTDKDFLQLSSKRVKIYNPSKKAHVAHPNPELFMVEQCLIGQKKDNIFNIKTPLDWPDGKRKPSFGEKAFEKVVIHGWEKWLDEQSLRERFEFNRNLMDFERIPKVIRGRIDKEYDDYTMPPVENILSFVERYGWPDYIERFNQVEKKLLEVY